ncbi:MAG TPA: hypothetical protein VFL85_04795 [Candidatus Saccharimonadales bacterium]|nr:hypothetical protein [Candidatus Saccharimonadales bacterium]
MAFSENTDQIRAGFYAAKRRLFAWLEQRRNRDMFSRTERLCYIWTVLALAPWLITRLLLRETLHLGYATSALYVLAAAIVVGAVSRLDKKYQTPYYATGAVLALALMQWVVYITYFGHLPFDPWIISYSWQLSTRWGQMFSWIGYLTPGLVIAVAVSLYWAHRRPSFREGVYR